MSMWFVDIQLCRWAFAEIGGNWELTLYGFLFIWQIFIERLHCTRHWYLIHLMLKHGRVQRLKEKQAIQSKSMLSVIVNYKFPHSFQLTMPFTTFHFKFEVTDIIICFSTYWWRFSLLCVNNTEKKLNPLDSVCL